MAQWSGIMRDRQASGMSIKQYCKEQGIQENSYYYWQKKLREAACEKIASTNQSAVPAGKAIIPQGWRRCEIINSLPEKVITETKTLSIEIGKCRVNISDTVSEGLLSTVCRTLINLC
jgi:putative transposase